MYCQHQKKKKKNKKLVVIKGKEKFQKITIIST